MSNIRNNDLIIEEIGDQHFSNNISTPLRKDAFEISDEQKIAKIEKHFASIMEILGLDLTDESLKGTPKRVAKMYVKELFSGLNPENFPDITLFENNYSYGEMLIERDVAFHSNCEHHFVPIVGKVHIGYVAKEKVVGLSKLHRVVEHFARRPQVQERMTIQIGQTLKEVLGTDDIAIIVDADHFCVSSRGIKDQSSSTVTQYYSGIFENQSEREQFLKIITLKAKSV